MTLCTQGQRAAVCDCQLYFCKPESGWIPLLPHHCLPQCPNQAPASSAYSIYHAGQFHNPAEQIPKSDGLSLIYPSLPPQAYSLGPQGKSQWTIPKSSCPRAPVRCSFFREDSWLSDLAWGSQIKGHGAYTILACLSSLIER